MNTGEGNKEARDFYNSALSEHFGDDYEGARWFSSERARAAYQMTRKSIIKRLLKKGGDINSVIEVGPGPGTWTKFLLHRYPTANFTLVDISSEMLSQARTNLKRQSAISFIHGDFMDIEIESSFDLFFSSRALEYFDEKKRAVEKVYSILNSGGRGFIITKYPRYWVYKIKGRSISALHGQQIRDTELRSLLKSCGFKVERGYPVTMTFPFVKSAFLDMLLYRAFSVLPLNPLSRLFTESYSINFSKP